MADKAIFQESVIDGEGNALTSGVTCELRRASDSFLVQLYSDRAGASPISNPAAGDSEGMVKVYVAPGVYNITLAHASFGTRQYLYQVLEASIHGADLGGSLVATNIGSGTQSNFDASLVEGVGVLDLNPNAGNTSLTSLVWDDLPDGAEVVVTNVHASNQLILVNGGAAAAGKAFRGFADLTLLQYMSAKLKKCTSLDKWVILP